MFEFDLNILLPTDAWKENGWGGWAPKTRRSGASTAAPCVWAAAGMGASAPPPGSAHAPRAGRGPGVRTGSAPANK